MGEGNGKTNSETSKRFVSRELRKICFRESGDRKRQTLKDSKLQLTRSVGKQVSHRNEKREWGNE